jgi:ADP-dependent NAD(P)H-hydrate dehydratase / NAD(P)H-hydrate epimerase
MKIFSADQIRAWDRFTIANEPIHSIELMERAARACTHHLVEHFGSRSFLILAGTGNNGGDGLAVARQLKQLGREVSVLHVGGTTLSPDCETNLQLLLHSGIPYKKIDDARELPGEVSAETVVIDAILGSGQNRPLEGLERSVAEKVNTWGRDVVAIDIPTGIFADRGSSGNAAIRARYTLSFQLPKLCFFVPENEAYVGEWTILDIGLSGAYYDSTSALFEYTELDDIRGMLRPRSRFAHKGHFGTALMMGGQKGMMGAAILAARACLRSGVGKLVSRVPGCGLDLMQLAAPEVICSVDENQDFLANPPVDLLPYSAIGIGPGIGKAPFTRELIRKMLRNREIPMVLDADALNIIAEEGWQREIPPGTVITPHIGEFSRLFGSDNDHFARIQKALQLSTELGIFIVVKGRNSFLSTPNGKGYFNSTGNPGMAKGGSGDVLTGMITGLLAQKYSVEQACRISVYVHGMAGDMAEKYHSTIGITASDIIDKIGFCYVKIFNN